MELQVGQRWRWVYTAGVGSDLILEVISSDTFSATFKTVQVIKGWRSEDYIGKTFSKGEVIPAFSSCSRLEYLEGQDKPG